MAVIGGGGGGNTPFPTIVFQTSRTWACPMAMEAMVFVIGAGGGGGAGVGVGGGYVGCNGGGGGGCSISKLTLAAQNYTVVVGAMGTGGNRATSAGVGVSSNQTAGGNSTFAGSGITTMAGNGGGAGTATVGGTTPAVAGGSATGGTIANNAGGGNASIYIPGGGAANVSGGGGVGLWEAGQNGAVTPTANTLAHGGGPFQTRGLNVGDIPGGEGGTASKSVVTGDIFSGLQQMVRDKQSNGTGTYRYTTSINHTGRSVSLNPPTNATYLRYLTGSSPFTGGTGSIQAGTSYYSVASPGVAGGGGGGAGNSNGSNATNYGGYGGGGIIIIMPLTVGA